MRNHNKSVKANSIHRGPSAPGKVREANGEKSDNPNFLYLTLIRYAISVRVKGHREKLRDEIVEICAVGMHLKSNILEWRRLVNADWGELKPPKLAAQKDALRHAFRWAVGTSGMGEKAASFYFNAVGPLVEKGLAGDALREAIRKTGLKKLQEMHSGAKRGQSPGGGKADIGSGYGGRVKAPPTAPAKVMTAERISSSKAASDKVGMVWDCEIRFKKPPDDLLKARVPFRIELTGSVTRFGKTLVIEDAEAEIT